MWTSLIKFFNFKFTILQSEFKKVCRIRVRLNVSEFKRFGLGLLLGLKCTGGVDWDRIM